MEPDFQFVGGCGCFQVCHVLFIQLIQFINVWALFFMAFGNYEPPWQCVKNNRTSNITSSFSIIHSESRENVLTILKGRHNLFKHKIDSADSTNQNISLSALSVWNVTENNDTSLHFQGTCSILPYCDFVMFDPTSVTLVTEYRLICDQAFIPSIIIAVQMLGMLFGASAGGQIGELFGRKVNIYISLAVLSIAVSVAAWSTSWQMYAVLTFFIGLGGGGIAASHLLYTLEFLTPKWRGRFGTLPVCNISLLIFAFIIFSLKSWRNIQMLCGGVAGLFLLGALWTSESLRWLKAHGKESQLKKVIKKIMKCNGRRYNMFEVLQQIDNKNGDVIDTDRKYTYFDLFRKSKIRILTIKGSIIWCSCLMGYYTLGFSIKSLSGDYYTNLFIAYASELPLILLLGPCVNTLGRRNTICVFMSLATMCTTTGVIAYYVANQNEARTVMKYAVILAKGCVNVGWSAVGIFVVELFPTVVRSLALGLFQTVARIGAICSSFLIPRDQESIIICFIVLTGVLLLGSVLIMSLPETKNRPLVDTID